MCVFIADALQYRKVCGVCVRLIADICNSEWRNKRGSIASEALPQLSRYLSRYVCTSPGV